MYADDDAKDNIKLGMEAIFIMFISALRAPCEAYSFFNDDRRGCMGVSLLGGGIRPLQDMVEKPAGAAMPEGGSEGSCGGSSGGGGRDGGGGGVLYIVFYNKIK
uniref:Uncharacterized protein n=1 Tax=Romanomermis culicivorax TaxID=13658 RepID=A0A915JP58_ROMCU